MQQLILDMNYKSNATFDRDRPEDLEMIRQYYMKYLQFTANHQLTVQLLIVP
jgi:hypothetical protein